MTTNSQTELTSKNNSELKKKKTKKSVISNNQKSAIQDMLRLQGNKKTNCGITDGDGHQNQQQIECSS